MQALFRKVFNVYPGEERRALLFALLGIVWSLAVNLGLQYSEALFLVHIGADALPKIYMASAVAMILPAALLFRVVNRVAADKIFLAIIALMATFYSFVFLLLITGYSGSDWFWYLLRVVSFQIWGVMVTGYWTFTDQYHNMQDAKRLYVLFSSAIFAGLGLTGLTMRAGAFSFEFIILSVVALSLFSCYLVQKIVKTLHEAHDETPIEETVAGNNLSFKHFLKQLRHSPFSLLIMASNFVIFLMWITAEYNYLSIFDKLYDPETVKVEGVGVAAPLTLFLGQCVAAVSLINLVFGLFFYSRTARRFGVGSLLLFSPTVLAMAFIGWMRYEALAFMILAYFVVEGSLEVIDDSNFNLLLNTVPRRLKYRVRIAIESFLEPAAMLIAGALLALPYINSKALALALALLALLIALMLRSRYHKAVYRTLAENAIHFERKVKEWFLAMGSRERKQERAHLYSYLSSSDPADALLAIEGILKLAEAPDITLILEKASTFSEEATLRFFDLLVDTGFFCHPKVTEKLMQWLKDSDNSAKTTKELLYILAKQGLLSPDTLYQELESADLKLRAAAILALKKGGAKQPIKAIATNRKTADLAIEELLNSDSEEEIATALNLIGEDDSPKQIHRLLPFLEHPNLSISRKAMQAIAKLANKQLRHNAKTLIRLMRRSQDSEFRKAAIRALGKFNDATLIRDIIVASSHFRQSERRLIEEIITAMGKRAVPKLLAVTKDLSIPHRCRALAGRILGHLALPYLQANLEEVVTIEIEKAYFYYYHKEFIESRYPEYQLQLLVDAMQTGFHTVVEFIIRILSAAAEVEDSTLLCRLFRSGNSKLRGQVVESLEKTCDRSIFRKLRPLLEEIPPEMVMRHFSKSMKPPLTLEELLEVMSSSPSQVDQIVSATLQKQLSLPNWREAIAKQAKNNRDELFQHLAQELLEK